MIKKWQLLWMVFAALLVSVHITGAQTELPTDTSTLFSGSGNCVMCHSSNGVAMTENGMDVSPITDWRSTMMANSPKDPLWRADLHEETAEFPQLQDFIEDRCATCHAPLGRTQAMYDGQDYFTFDQIDADPLARDGVSCTLCHQIQAGNLGQPDSFSGNYDINDSRTIFGPYTDPLTMPMFNMTGFTPAYGAQVHESTLCATCHTLFTPTIDYEGNIVGEFPEQTPYLEWLNSTAYQAGESCQTCHMPQTQTPIDISIIPPWHQVTHTPFWKHHFVGGNVFIQRMMRDNITELGLSASVANFDSTIARALNSLQSHSVEMTTSHEVNTGQLNLDVHLQNLAGHKLPSGIPIRRMWLHVRVTNETNQVVFESGAWDDDGFIIDMDDGYEPHYDVITAGDQVQIFEGVMVDVNNEVTNTLLRAATFIKDNRLPPAGFMSDHPEYTHTAIYGAAADDPNFNYNAQGEGSGSDVTHYEIGLDNGSSFTVMVELCYQTVKPHFVEHIFEFDHAEIDAFETMYNQADKAPIIMAQTTFEVGQTTEIEESDSPTSTKLRLFPAYPNPFTPSTSIAFQLAKAGTVRLTVYDTAGRRVQTLLNEFRPAGDHTTTWDGKTTTGQMAAAGIYYVQLETNDDMARQRIILVK